MILRAEKLRLAPDFPYTATDIGKMFTGLRSMSKARHIQKSQGAASLLTELCRILEQLKKPLDGRGIGTILHALNKMSSDSPEVQSILREMVVKMKQSKAELNAQEIGNALYGLQGMSSDSPEVQSILRELAVKMKQSKAALNAQNIGNALYG